MRSAASVPGSYNVRPAVESLLENKCEHPHHPKRNRGKTKGRCVECVTAFIEREVSREKTSGIREALRKFGDLISLRICDHCRAGSKLIGTSIMIGKPVFYHMVDGELAECAASPIFEYLKLDKT